MLLEFTDVKNGMINQQTRLSKDKMDLFRKLKKMKILLVDDDEWIRDSMKWIEQ